MHEKDLQEFRKEIQLLRSDMQPIIDTFKMLRTIGKWAAVSVAFAGSLAGAILAIKQLFKKGS